MFTPTWPASQSRCRIFLSLLLPLLQSMLLKHLDWNLHLHIVKTLQTSLSSLV